MKRAYRARILSPTAEGASLRRLDDGLIVVEDGRFAAIGPFAEAAFPGPVLDLRPRVVLPGFIDTHLHFPQTRVIGSASGPLLDWLERTVFPEEARFHDEAYARIVADEFTSALLSVGTTTSAIFSSSSPSATTALFEALDAAGLRAIVGLTLMDQACPAALALPRGQAIDACERLIERFHGHDGGRLGFAVTPRFAVSCSRPLLEDAGRLAAAHDLVIQTHIAETPAEGEATLVAHPYAKDYLGVYEAAGLVTSRTVLAHAIHLSASEWERIAAHEARIAHCPDSNFFLGSGRMRLAEAEARGVPVALGSDVAAGRSFDMRRAMSSAHDNALALGQRSAPETWLTMATLGGAKALGLDAVTGSIEVGKDADFIALRLPDHAEDWERILGFIAFSLAGAVERVFVRGRPVYSAKDRYSVR